MDDLLVSSVVVTAMPCHMFNSLLLRGHYYAAAEKFKMTAEEIGPAVDL